MAVTPSSVWTVSEERVRGVAVVTGATRDDSIEVREGLRGGETVVTPESNVEVEEPKEKLMIVSTSTTLRL